MHKSSFRSRSKALYSINVVPYIDVMLVLLIIFMTTAPAFTPEVVNLPSVGKADQVTKTPIQVVIQSDKKYLLKVNNQNKLTTDKIQTLIEEIKKQPKTPIVIEADQQIIYKEVMNLMDALQKAKLGQIGLLVKPST